MTLRKQNKERNAYNTRHTPPMTCLVSCTPHIQPDVNMMPGGGGDGGENAAPWLGQFPLPRGETVQTEKSAHKKHTDRVPYRHTERMMHFQFSSHTLGRCRRGVHILFCVGGARPLRLRRCCSGAHGRLRTVPGPLLPCQSGLGRWHRTRRSPLRLWWCGGGDLLELHGRHGHAQHLHVHRPHVQTHGQKIHDQKQAREALGQRSKT